MVLRTRTPRTGKHLLSDLKLKSLVKNMKAGDHSDGHRLVLSIVPAQNRCAFVFRLPPGCEKREVGLGPARPNPTEAIKVARAKADRANELIRAGVDPSGFLRGSPAPVAVETRTFREDAEAFLAIRAAWLKPGAKRHWDRVLARHSALLAKPVAAVTEGDILAVLEGRPDEAKRRVFWVLRKILAWSKDQGHIATNPAAFILENKIPLAKPSKEHFPSMPCAEVPAFMAGLRENISLASLCVQWIVLTACRNTEGRDARWSEIDEKAGLWSIPACRMKQSRDHVVPLSSQALAILAMLDRRGPRMFTARRKRDACMAPLPLYKLVPEGVTLHGYRASFAEWSFEHGFSIPMIDLALAHIVGGTITRAYVRGALVAERRPMMQGWGDFCGGPTRIFTFTKNVIEQNGAS
jgi:integrase